MEHSQENVLQFLQYIKKASDGGGVEPPLVIRPCGFSHLENGQASVFSLLIPKQSQDLLQKDLFLSHLAGILQGIFMTTPFFGDVLCLLTYTQPLRKIFDNPPLFVQSINFVPPAVQQLILNCIYLYRKFSVMEISMFGVGSFFMEFHGDPHCGWTRSSKPALRRLRPNKYVVHVVMLLLQLLLTQTKLHCCRYIYREDGNQNSVKTTICTRTGNKNLRETLAKDVREKLLCHNVLQVSLWPPLTFLFQPG